MAGWEEELAAILRELGVEQEMPARRRQSRQSLRRNKQTGENLSEVFSRNSSPSAKNEPQEAGQEVEREERDVDEEDDIWMNDLEMMRYEIDSIVSQVIRLMQRGDLEPSLKDDVMVVLRALRRRATVTQQAAKSDEAYLESASAMLHFCRLVLQLSEVATEE